MFLKIFLYPFSILYNLVTAFRNHLYNIGYKRSFHFETNIISVGNLTIGGTGKSPHVEYLIRLLKDQYKVATLSRGYGRKTKGFIIADDKCDWETIGDEPMQFYRKFVKPTRFSKPRRFSGITIAVCEDRALAIPQILFEKPDTDVIILDDAFQHRPVIPDLNILLTDYNRQFYNDLLLPAGRLRESRKNAQRADVIIVTKCPENLPEDERRKIETKIRKYSVKESSVFFTGIKYNKPVPVFKDRRATAWSGGMPDQKSILLFSGIADNTSLKNELEKKYKLTRSLDFGDHHNYSATDILKIKNEFSAISEQNKCLLTTEKDMVKLLKPELAEHLKELPVFYVPIEVYFLEGKKEFDGLVLNAITLQNI